MRQAPGVKGLKDVVDERCSWHWVGIGITNFESCHLEQIQRVYLKRAFSQLYGRIDAPDMIIKASKSFVEMYNKTLKPSPTTFLKRINQRHILYIMKGILEIPSNYYKMKENVAFIFMHEVCRTVLDRFIDVNEKEELYEKTKDICQRIFDEPGRTFASSKYMDEVSFCYGQGDASYNETPASKKLEMILNEAMMEYNKANPREELDIIIFDTITEKTLKINRSIRQMCASTILIANVGSGAIELVKMAIKLAGALDYELMAKGGD